MSNATPSHANRRSWTDGESAPSNRMGMLAFLSISVAALTFALIWFLLTGAKKNDTFLLPLSVTNYPTNIPKVNYGVWNQSSLHDKGLSPSRFSDERELENDVQMKLRIKGFVDELKKLGRNPAKTTVLIQLRCHAVVTSNGEDLSCGLFLGEFPNDTMYPIKALLEDLGEIPANNIVLFADVCDLKSVAFKGWLTNPVTTYFKKACEGWKGKANQNIWVVCAADDYQDTFYSDLRKKTLFEDACEYAVQFRQQKELNLWDMYESILRYCHSASREKAKGDGTSIAKQTPRLIWANGSGAKFLSAESMAEFEPDAKKVLIGSKSSSSPPPSPAKANKEDEEGPSKTPISSALKRRSLEGSSRLVAMTYSSNEAGLDPTNAQGDPAEIKLDEDESLAFWQIRDRISKRIQKPGTNRMRWSPADFAPMQWRKWQLDAVSEVDFAKDRFKELQELDNLLEKSVSKNDSKANDLLQAWNDFLESKQNQLRLWQGDDNVLTTEELNEWTRVRSLYRDYIDSVSELAFWSAFESTDNRFVNAYSELIECLEVARKKLPEELHDSAIDRSIGMQLEPAVLARESLRKWLADRCANLERKKEISWIDEREYQILLASPLLSYEQRKSLLLQQKNKKIKLAEVIVDLDSKLSALLPASASSSEFSDRKVNSLVRMASLHTSNLPMPPKDRYLQFGKDFLVAMQMASTPPSDQIPKSQIRHWHFLSLADTNFAAPVSSSKNKSFAGIVVSPISPKAIRLSLAASSLDFADTEDETKLRINVKRVDETEVEECSLQWTTSQELPNFGVRFNSKPSPKNTPIKINPQSKQVVLDCSFPRSGKIPDGLELILNLDGEKSSLRIPVHRDTNRIDLVATRVSKSGQTIEKISPDENKELRFSGPAIAGTTNRFAFSLQNKKRTPRRAQLKVYSSPASDNPSPNAQPTLLAESAIVAVPVGEQGVPVKLTPSKEQPSPLELESAHDTILSFKIFEFDLESTSASQDSTPAKEIGKPFEYTGRFDPKPPVSDYIRTPTLGKVKNGERFSIEFETAPNFFERYEAADPIPIAGSISLDTQKKLEPKMLSQGKTKDVIFGPVIDGTKSYDLWFDIGGFPRAIVYRVNPKLEKLEEVNVPQVQISEIYAKREGKDQQRQKLDRDFSIVPHLTAVGKEFELAKWESIEIETKTDLVGNFVVLEVLSKSGSPVFSQTIKHDRRYQAKLTVDAALGTFQVAFKAAELRVIPFPKLDGSFNEVFTVKLSIPGQQPTLAKIVFDQDKPPKAEIACNNSDLYDGEVLEVSIEPSDPGAGIKGVEFALVRESVGKPSFLSEDAEKLDPKNVSTEKGRYKLEMDSKGLAARPPGIFYIVARTIDRAGNYQDENEPLKFHWKKVKRPGQTK